MFILTLACVLDIQTKKIMPMPVRCITCGKVVCNKWDGWVQGLKHLDSDAKGPGEDKNTLLVSLGVRRDCCIRMFRTHVDNDDLELDVAEAAQRAEKENTR
jgi:DNA-directed RNA polymerase subunit N (RpoN/RPB10)